jgi:hypothetical protein
MCLCKQPRRRYRTALELADDLRRCAEGLPVLARPINVFVRLGRWVRRRPGVLVWLLICALVACGSYYLGEQAGYFRGVYQNLNKYQKEYGPKR